MLQLALSRASFTDSRSELGARGSQARFGVLLSPDGPDVDVCWWPTDLGGRSKLETNANASDTGSEQVSIRLDSASEVGFTQASLSSPKPC